MFGLKNTKRKSDYIYMPCYQVFKQRKVSGWCVFRKSPGSNRKPDVEQIRKIFGSYTHMKTFFPELQFHFRAAQRVNLKMLCTAFC